MSFRSTPPNVRGVSALKILGIVFLILIITCGGVAFYVYRNFRSLAANAFHQMATQAIAQANLPQDQKTSILGNLDRLRADFESGAMSMEELGEIMQTLDQGPFFTLVQIEFVRQQCLKGLPLTDEQTQEMSLTFDRFERAIVEDDVPAQQLSQIMGTVENKKASKQSKTVEVRGDLSPEELQDFVDRIREAADDAEIPLTPYQVDFAGLFQEAIDGALKPASPAPQTQTKPAT